MLNAWERFKQWVMFPFDFDDILRVKDSLRCLMASGLSSLGPFFQNLSTHVEGAFDDLQAQLYSAFEDEEAAATSGGHGSSESEIAQEHGSIMDSSSFQYVGYQLGHGGAGSFTLPIPGSRASSAYLASSLEIDRSVKTLRKLGGVGSKALAVAAEDDPLTILRDIANEFDLRGALSASECTEKLGVTVISNILESIKDIITMNLELVGDLFEILRNLLTAEIKMPVFSALYRALTGSELTILDAICLIIAHVTIIAKITGQRNLSAL